MSRQSTLNVSLTPKLEKYVRAKAGSGGYGLASEVIRDGLRAPQERERAATAFWTGVREKVAAARQQVARGQTLHGEAAMDEILAELRVPDGRNSATRSWGQPPTPAGL